MELQMRHRTRRSRERGLSIIEGLITMALIAIVLLALAPLFSQSVNVNASSSQLSVGNSLVREKLEELLTYPTTDPRLAVPAGSRSNTFANDLPSWVKPATGETSTATTSPGAGWYPFPYERTYTVEPFVTGLPPNPLVATASMTGDESTYNLPGSVPYYEVKLVAVTVRPTTGPFIGLRRTTQSAYARYRNAQPN
jgi:type II secretory pathway pseudopilin PulG